MKKSFLQHLAGYHPEAPAATAAATSAAASLAWAQAAAARVNEDLARMARASVAALGIGHSWMDLDGLEFPLKMDDLEKFPI